MRIRRRLRAWEPQIEKHRTSLPAHSSLARETKPGFLPALTPQSRPGAPSSLAAGRILALQKTVGNSATQGFLMRTLGDGHDLTSPRFAGDPILEACYDDRARLTTGSNGPPVVKVQQALIDLGYDLGPAGADGKYGTFTWNAVKQFKADQRLGWEHMGDVGPGTMGRLDELFPAGPQTEAVPTKYAQEEPPGPLSCPSTDDLVMAANHRPALAEVLVKAAAPSVRPIFRVPGLGSGDPIQDAVDRFKARVDVASPLDPSHNVSSGGQFFWSSQLWAAITAELNRMSAEPTAAAFVAKAKAARDAIWADRDADATRLLLEAQAIASTTRSPERAAMRALLKGPASSGSDLENTLWAALNKSSTNTLPNLAPHRSLPTLRTLNYWDNQGCGPNVSAVVGRLKKRGGMGGAGRPMPFYATVATGAGLRDLRPMEKPASTFGAAATAAVKPGSGYMLGDHIFQTRLSDSVAKIKTALDSGLVVHARVVSGAIYGEDPPPPILHHRPVQIGPPPEEHSLLIIGYDGDSFVFHDPDAGVSHSPETGFGLLHYDPTDDRLSTAADPTKMPVDADGKHEGGNKRYQVINLNTM